jgi:hypothetical protein
MKAARVELPVLVFLKYARRSIGSGRLACFSCVGLVTFITLSSPQKSQCGKGVTACLAAWVLLLLLQCAVWFGVC